MDDPVKDRLPALFPDAVKLKVIFADTFISKGRKYANALSSDIISQVTICDSGIGDIE